MDLQIFGNLTTLPRQGCHAKQKNLLWIWWCSGFEMAGDLDDCELWPQIDVCYALSIYNQILYYYTNTVGLSSCTQEILFGKSFAPWERRIMHRHPQSAGPKPTHWLPHPGRGIPCRSHQAKDLCEAWLDGWRSFFSCVCSPTKDLWNLNICWELIW